MNTREEQVKLVKKLLKTGVSDDARMVLERQFPEVLESEDERIRKRLIDCLKFSLKGAEEQDAAGCSRQKDIEAYKWGISYLEKQKEQKPAEWSEEDEKMLNRIIRNLDDLGYEEFCLSSRDQDAPEDRLYFEEIEWLKDLRHKIKQDVPSIIVDENCFKVPVNCVDAYNELHDYLSGLFRQYVECKTPITKDNIDADWSMMYPYVEKYVASVIGNCSPLDDHAFRSFYSAGYKKGKAEHWKPSEEQTSMLLSILNEPNSASSESARLMLESLYNDLKAL